MTDQQNTRIVLASRPTGKPTADNFRLEQVQIAAPAEGEVLLRNHLLSLDPYMRGRMDAGPSYAAPVPVDGVMEGRTVAQVLESRHPDFNAGQWVVASGGWQTRVVVPGAQLARKLDPDGPPLSTALGVFGMPGFTAYAGLREIGRPRAGETLVVAAASGPVGATVGQLARLQGVRVVGIAGGETKRRYLEQIGFDVALDHRAPDFVQALAAAVPDGIDIYFENVGGAVFQAVLPHLNDFARIPVCGTVSNYNTRHVQAQGPDLLPGFIGQVLRQRLTVRGFIQTDFAALFPAFESEMRGLLLAGQIQYREDVVEGLAQAPQALIDLLDGKNFGKALVKLD
jgi:NADPH-dependent curcumin reductase CurA